jgi:phosphonopyruvate decarboxylase
VLSNRAIPEDDSGFSGMTETTKTMLSCKALFEALTTSGVGAFYGVPDSTLAPLCSYLEDKAQDRHIGTANEGNAVGLAAGYYLATSKLPLVYMQNSGLGNALDPLVSLADTTVMSIPMILLIGWRGEPGKKDEPQHTKQGAITTELLNLLGISFVVLSSDSEEAHDQVKKAAQQAEQSQMPFALLVQDGTLEPYGRDEANTDYPLSREEALEIIIKSLDEAGAIVATNGKVSRELYDYRESQAQGHEKDLLIVGAMGHASSIALGIAQSKLVRKIYCIDGDGSALMHMGALAINGTRGPKNFYHIVINNGSHDSTGGQPTVGFDIDLPGVAIAAGYKKAYLAQDQSELSEILQKLKTLEGPILIEVRVKPGARKDLSRPATSPKENKKAFMAFIDEEVHD